MPTTGGPGQQAIPEAIQSDAGHARYRYGDAGKVLTQQQLPDERGTISNANPVAASPTVAKINTHFIA